MGQYQQPPPPGYGTPPPQQQYQAPPVYGPRFMHADIVHRFIALLIDGIILGVLYFALSVLFAFAGFFAFSATGFIGFSVWTFVLMGVWFLLALLYFMVQEGGANNATIGKKIMHLKVVDTSYQPIDMSKALIRNLMRLWFIPGVSFIVLIVDIILVLTRPDKQRLGDIVAHTYVVENRQMGPQPYYAPPPPAYGTPPPPQQPPPQPARFCQGCGRQIPPNHHSCPNCGKPA